MYHKTKSYALSSKLSNETIYGLIPYKEGYVNEAYTFFGNPAHGSAESIKKYILAH